MAKNRFNFETVPTIHKARSRMDLSHNIDTTFNLGDLVPLDCTEVLPGDTFNTEFTAVIRTSSPFIKPIYGNLYMDVYHFFVPLRLVYEDATKIFGNPSPSAYIENDFAEVPSTDRICEVSSGTVADHLGLPLGSIPSGINILPFRAFAKIYNEWFRNQNVIDETYVQMGEFNGEQLNNLAWSPNNYLGKLPKVAKKKDYFTACLPRPQKGESVLLNLSSNQAPIKNVDLVGERSSEFAISPKFWYQDGNGYFTSFGQPTVGGQNISLFPSSQALGFGYLRDGNGNVVTNGSINRAYMGLVADLSHIDIGNINDLRLAFAMQRMLELDARGGTRYNELLASRWGVHSPDARLQFTEFLGGGRIPINITQVNSTVKLSYEGVTSDLGEVGAFSLSSGKSKFIKGFVEHGYVFTVGCVRQIHSYQQGIEKMWLRKDRNDFYDPLFAHLGEQPVYTQEIFAQSTVGLRENVLGYNEAWAEYRYKPNSISGQFRSNAENSLDIWHIADFYGNRPTLTANFIEENTANIDRVLSVDSTKMDNFILDGFFKTSAIRVMPVRSIPSLIDHTY